MVHVYQSCELPATLRLISKNELKGIKPYNFIGKGAFAKCFAAQMGPLKVCIKVLYAGIKYRPLLLKESRILSELCHFNLPWIHCLCNSSDHTAIIMTFHGYSGNKSLTIHSALHKTDTETKLSDCHWKQILLGSVSALVYLKTKCIIHNDIKSDNILIENLSHDFRAILVDFNKACYLGEARLYNLTSEERLRYAKDHPQIAPEVRDGYKKQSFMSDIYSIGRIIQKINSSILKIPLINSMAMLCLDSDCEKRPNALELETCLTNLFSL